MLIPHLTGLLLSVKILLQPQTIVSAGAIDVKAWRDFHEHLALDVGLRESKNKINLARAPSIHDGEAEEQPDRGPADHWRVRLSIIDVLCLAATMEI